jgi:hypothetical protein
MELFSFHNGPSNAVAAIIVVEIRSCTVTESGNLYMPSLPFRSQNCNARTV